ncbi:hypothetical protein RJ55_08459 [Drechmeria coniospora]|nr:hypothetical protein RJ55_08459 [Drechmeria coniospora]
MALHTCNHLKLPFRSAPSHPSRKNTAEAVATSRLHYLVPASRGNIELCYNLVSSAVNRYPVPALLGWNGTAEFDAAGTHLAKLRVLKRYLHSLPPEEDDDLVLFVDGFDVIQQLPPDVVIERYFDIARKADAQLAKRLGMTVEEAHRRNLRQAIFWGPDNYCFPMDPRAPRCWAVPASTLPSRPFGPGSERRGTVFDYPRWLNSGTFMGPVGHVRRLIDVAMNEIAATYDARYQFRESDQYYIANIFGRQEYWRSKLAANGGYVGGGPEDRVIPEKSETEDTELHAALEYESALFQTKAGYESFFGYLQFNQSRRAASMNMDMFGLGQDFRPYLIEMPSNVWTALTKLYDSIPEAHPGTAASDWIRTVNLGVNFVTNHIYGILHCTGSKNTLAAEYSSMWWRPFARSLLKAAVKSSQAGDLISPGPIDGRMWAAKTYLPDSKTLPDEYGGAMVPGVDGASFISWRDLCGPYEDTLLGGEGNLANRGSRER